MGDNSVNEVGLALWYLGRKAQMDADTAATEVDTIPGADLRWVNFKSKLIETDLIEDEAGVIALLESLPKLPGDDDLDASEIKALKEASEVQFEALLEYMGLDEIFGANGTVDETALANKMAEVTDAPIERIRFINEGVIEEQREFIRHLGELVEA